jgi:hypothetical protein
MRIAAFFQTRVFAIIAASLAVIAIFIVVSSPQGPNLSAIRPALSPPAETAPTPETSTDDKPLPAVVEARLEPQSTPRDQPDRDLTSAFPPSSLPDVATARGAGISLACLAKNGADLSKPMPSKHTVFAANAEIAARLRAWAAANGFQVRDPEVLRDHVGKVQYRLDLVRLEVPVPEEIEKEARLILSAVQQIPGTYYQTWSGEIVR